MPRTRSNSAMRLCVFCIREILTSSCFLFIKFSRSAHESVTEIGSIWAKKGDDIWEEISPPKDEGVPSGGGEGPFGN